MKKILFALVVLAFAKAGFSQQEIVTDPALDYYLPLNPQYDPSIPTPQSVLGYVPGKWHVTHDKLVQYMRQLAASSNRITIEDRGKTFEDRPLLLLTITSPENHERIDKIKQHHLAATDDASVDRANDPIVVYQGFSIHGNEPSGSNAALLYAYHLAASPQVDDILENTVILLDPSLNPDGLQRFAGWVNQHKNNHVNPDNYDREYDEVWPGGRTNHYWFDMNRDWLPVQLPESQARIKTFHEWLPNILTDHHEMGTNSTFFFQPGIPSRTNPLTPVLNQQLTEEIGTYHAAAFDKIGSLYYSKESFDDFYYGKGSTFPDINGGIGILFEQGSSRGHAQNSDNGVLTFPFTIRNQLTAAISTVDAAVAMRSKILDYQQSFYNNAEKEGAAHKGILVGSPGDRSKLKAFIDLLSRHEIEYRSLLRPVVTDGKTYDPQFSIAIPERQKKGRLIKAMFQKRTTFQDSLFYDVSAWTLPLAFDLDYTPSTSIKDSQPYKSIEATITSIAPGAYAYLIPWSDFLAPKVVYDLLEKGLRVKTAMKEFTSNGVKYASGTIMVPTANQDMAASQIYDLMKEIQKEGSIDIGSATTGLTAGINLGSREFRNVELPKIAVLVGEGINPYDAGEIWHLMDQRFNINITKLDLNSLTYRNLDRYNTIVVPATYGTPDKEVIENLKTWTRDGGTLIGYRNALRWLSSSKMLPLEFKKVENKAVDVTFGQRSDFNGAQVIGGAIFETSLDLSHPIAFGYRDAQLPVFRNTTLFVKPHKDSYRNPIKYTANPLMSGYISSPNLEALAGTVPFQHNNYGGGDVIGFTDNTQFRAFWYGTNRLLINAIFFAENM
ncbi:MAG: M14 family metallopeptidase [Nonlabens sp.]